MGRSRPTFPNQLHWAAGLPDPGSTGPNHCCGLRGDRASVEGGSSLAMCFPGHGSRRPAHFTGGLAIYPSLGYPSWTRARCGGRVAPVPRQVGRCSARSGGPRVGAPSRSSAGRPGQGYLVSVATDRLLGSVLTLPTELGQNPIDQHFQQGHQLKPVRA